MFLWIRRESCLSWPQRNDVGVGSQGGVPLLSNKPYKNTRRWADDQHSDGLVAPLFKLSSTTLIRTSLAKEALLTYMYLSVSNRIKSVNSDCAAVNWFARFRVNFKHESINARSRERLEARTNARPRGDRAAVIPHTAPTAIAIAAHPTRTRTRTRPRTLTMVHKVLFWSGLGTHPASAYLTLLNEALANHRLPPQALPHASGSSALRCARSSTRSRSGSTPSMLASAAASATG